MQNARIIELIFQRPALHWREYFRQEKRIVNIAVFQLKPAALNGHVHKAVLARIASVIQNMLSLVMEFERR